MIDVSMVVNSPELAQSFIIERSTGAWQNGVWISNVNEVQGYGVVSVATEKDIVMSPEGDVIHGDMVFHSSAPIYMTRATSEEGGGSSDILRWRGHKFRVLRDAVYVDYGYFRATAVRMSAKQ